MPLLFHFEHELHQSSSLTSCDLHKININNLVFTGKLTHDETAHSLYDTLASTSINICTIRISIEMYMSNNHIEEIPMPGSRPISQSIVTPAPLAAWLKFDMDSST